MLDHECSDIGNFKHFATTSDKFKKNKLTRPEQTVSFRNQTEMKTIKKFFGRLARMYVGGGMWRDT